MTCAMHVHDPCAGELALCRLMRGVRVPLCEKHVDAWDTCTGPFGTMGEGERDKWARWAAHRARRQEAGLKTPADTTPTGARSLRVTRKQSSR